jgi:glutathione S-transferase
MNPSPPILYHSPNTRSTGVLTLLEELGGPYELRVLNMKAGEQRGAAYLAINPMGKVPAVVHDGALITEQVAIYIYLADLYPERGLAPPIGDPLRGPYLRWLAFYGSCYEPAIIDRSMKRESAPASTSPYGDFATTWRTLTEQLSPGPWLLGDRMTAADVLWGTALEWTVGFKLAPETPVVLGYIDRMRNRPAARRVRAREAELAAAQAAAG